MGVGAGGGAEGEGQQGKRVGVGGFSDKLSASSCVPGICTPCPQCGLCVMFSRSDAAVTYRVPLA